MNKIDNKIFYLLFAVISIFHIPILAYSKALNSGTMWNTTLNICYFLILLQDFLIY